MLAGHQNVTRALNIARTSALKVIVVDVVVNRLASARLIEFFIDQICPTLLRLVVTRRNILTLSLALVVAILYCTVIELLQIKQVIQIDARYIRGIQIVFVTSARLWVPFVQLSSPFAHDGIPASLAVLALHFRRARIFTLALRSVQAISGENTCLERSNLLGHCFNINLITLGIFTKIYLFLSLFNSMRIGFDLNCRN